MKHTEGLGSFSLEERIGTRAAVRNGYETLKHDSYRKGNEFLTQSCGVGRRQPELVKDSPSLKVSVPPCRSLQDDGGAIEKE